MRISDWISDVCSSDLFLVTVVITQIVTIVIQCIALIVQSTATALIYVDSRMRHEGLDLDLLSYVERRDAGAQDLPDPYRVHIGRSLALRPPQVPGWGRSEEHTSELQSPMRISYALCCLK